MSVAKEPIFAGTNQVSRLYIALSGLQGSGKSMKAAVEDSFNKILSSIPQLLTGPAGIYARYTVEPARTWRTTCGAGARNATRTTG